MPENVYEGWSGENIAYDSSDPFGQAAHNKHNPTHSGEDGHFCLDWDELWICKDCSEYECCTCLPEDR